MSRKILDRRTDRFYRFCTVSNIPEQMELLKDTCRSFYRWAWIEHQPDSEDGKPHIHVMVRYSGSCKLSTASRLLQVPEHMVQFCDSNRGYGQYMIHLHNDEKIKYSFDDIHTNCPGLFKTLLIDSNNDDVISIFHDLDKLQRGSISFDEFCSLHFVDLQRMSLYQQVKTYESLRKLACVPTT